MSVSETLEPTTEEAFDAVATRFRIETGDQMDRADEAQLNQAEVTSFIGLYYLDDNQPYYQAWVELPEWNRSLHLRRDDTGANNMFWYDRTNTTEELIA